MSDNEMWGVTDEVPMELFDKAEQVFTHWALLATEEELEYQNVNVGIIEND